MYWEESDDVKYVPITNIMHCNRLVIVMRFLHFIDNQKFDRTDKTHKLPPYTQMLVFFFTIWESECSIDKAMIPYNGRHGIK